MLFLGHKQTAASGRIDLRLYEYAGAGRRHEDESNLAILTNGVGRDLSEIQSASGAMSESNLQMRKR